MTDRAKEEELTLTELEAVLPAAFLTTDFDFAAFLIAGNPDTGKPYAKVEDIRPSERSRGSQGRDRRFEFVMTATGDLPEDETLHSFEMQYTNRLSRVEPLAFSSARKQLRALLDKMRREADQQNKRQRRQT